MCCGQWHIFYGKFRGGRESSCHLGKEKSVGEPKQALRAGSKQNCRMVGEGWAGERRQIPGGPGH